MVSSAETTAGSPIMPWMWFLTRRTSVTWSASAML